MELRKVIAILLCFCLCSNVLLAQREAVKKSTDPLCLLPSATALALTWAKGDMEGMKQLAWSSVTAIGMNYALEFCIKEKRPDGTGDHAFPSTHTMAAFSGASFLQRRYGWNGVHRHTLSQLMWAGDVCIAVAIMHGMCWLVLPSVLAALSSIPGLLSMTWI